MGRNAESQIHNAKHAGEHGRKGNAADGGNSRLLSLAADHPTLFNTVSSLGTLPSGLGTGTLQRP